MPAARGLAGPPKCVRCQSVLLPPAEARALACVSDCGLELDSFANRPLPLALRAPANGLSDVDLRRYQRLLRPMRWDDGHARASLYGPTENLLDTEQGDAAIHLSAINLSRGSHHESSPAWGVSLLLLTGGTTLVLGVLLLAAANLLLHPSAWRWGFAVAIASEGLLTVAVAMMATRLWRNSRRLNNQLAAVDHRLCEVQSTLAQSTLAQPSSRVSTSSLRTALRRLDSPSAMPR